MNYPYAFLDLDGCGGIAFYISRRPLPGEVASPADVLLTNGTKPDSKTLVLCGACGKPIAAMMTNNIAAIA